MPLVSKRMLRGGGGEITSTDCYSFVPIPDNAIELDENTPDSGNSLDGAWGPFDLDFDFCHFGISYDQFYINMKGNITFDNFNTTFVPAGFPSDDFAMIAGYWADIDLTCGTCGTVYYWTTPTAAYITFLDVGYYLDHGNLDNTFQIVITDQTDEVVGLGNNVGLFYQDMQWAAGDWNGGVGGFDGTAAGTVGANRNDGVNFIQFGRFLEDSDAYDGPFGVTDGIDWLDDKAFVFNLCSDENNLPPIAGNSDNCDTLFICQNDFYDFDLSFIGPEPGQTVSVVVDDSQAIGWTENSNGDGFSTGVFVGGADNVGEHTLVFTATDNGTPQGITVVTYEIVVLDLTLPELTVTGPDFNDNVIPYCSGQPGAEVMASDGFDDYVWSNNTNGQSNTFSSGSYSLVGLLEGCQAEFGPFSVYQIPGFNPIVVVEDYFLCEGETTELELQNPELYSEFSWEVFNNNGEILSGGIGDPIITATPGEYQVSAINETGCLGSVVIPVTEEVVSIPNTDFVALCDDNDAISWSGAWANPNSCLYALYMYDSGADSWEGANIEVYIDGTGPLNFNIANNTGFAIDGFSPFHGQIIEYYFTEGFDDADISVQILNEDDDVVFDTNLGDELTSDGLPFFTQIADCGFNALPGTWEVTAPVGGEGYTLESTDVFNPVNEDNTFTAPDGFNGSYLLNFNSAICDNEIEFTLDFSVTPTVEAPDYDGVCSTDGILIEPIYGTSGAESDYTYDWDPNDLGDGPTAFTNSSGPYTISIENVCGIAQDNGIIDFIPVPSASLFNDVLCNGEIGVLDPGTDHPSFVYEWSTGEDTPSIEVSTANDYSVTVSNDCGDAESSAFINVGRAATVEYNVDTVLFCAGEVQNIAPIWNNGEGIANPVIWTISYVDQSLNTQSEILSSTSSSIEVASEQISANSISNSVTLNYFTDEFCGDAQGSVELELIPCNISAPNVITPNGDGGVSAYQDINDASSVYNQGLNEAWYLDGIGRLKGVQVRIFDRWGNLVYEDSNYSNNAPWIGEDKNGNELTNGVYFYTISAGNNIDPLEGTVTIFR